MRAPYGTYVRIINLLSFLSFQGACDHLLTFFRFCFAGMWTLDPIDGTKEFLRGRQYAVCLALLVDARVELGVIGSPNLPSTPPPGHLKTPLPEPRQNAQTTTAPAAAPSWHPIPTTQQLPQLPPPPTAATSALAFSVPHGTRRLSMAPSGPTRTLLPGVCGKGSRGARHRRARRDASRRGRRARAHGFAGEVCRIRARRRSWRCLLAVACHGPRPRRWIIRKNLGACTGMRRL
jgi:hypothetical protein